MKKIVLLIGLLGMSLFAEMTPEKYYELELKAQEITFEGKEMQLSCAQRKCLLSEIYNIDGEYQSKVSNLYTQYGTTPSKIIVYYTHNEKKINQYLSENIALQNKLDENLEKFEAKSQQIENQIEENQ